MKTQALTGKGRKERAKEGRKRKKEEKVGERLFQTGNSKCNTAEQERTPCV